MQISCVCLCLDMYVWILDWKANFLDKKDAVFSRNRFALVKCVLPYSLHRSISRLHRRLRFGKVKFFSFCIFGSSSFLWCAEHVKGKEAPLIFGRVPEGIYILHVNSTLILFYSQITEAMKVTVSFRGTKIVVPCGDGDISVRQLTNLSSTRYKKAVAGKVNPRHHWVSVSSLRSHEGGMLDPDDRICDVCDDREQLDAVYEEQISGHGHAGDGMSSSGEENNKIRNDLEDDDGEMAAIADSLAERAGLALQVRNRSIHLLHSIALNSP